MVKHISNDCGETKEDAAISPKVELERLSVHTEIQEEEIAPTKIQEEEVAPTKIQVVE